MSLDGQPTFYTPVSCPLLPAHGPSTLTRVCDAFGAGAYADRLFDLLSCSRCGLGITSPVPTEASAYHLYADRSSCDFQPDESRLSSALKARAATRDARAYARFTSAPRRILDFGCGDGAFALAFQRVFPAATVTGADTHPDRPARLPDSIRYCSYEVLSEAEGHDLILARHVLEHTYDPIQTLIRLHSLLTPGGMLAIEVPNFTAGLRHVFGRRWDGYYAPFHPIHFTAGSLALAATAAKLAIRASGSAEMPKMGRSLHNVLGGPYAPLFGLGILLQPAQMAIGTLFGPTCLRLWVARER